MGNRVCGHCGNRFEYPAGTGNWRAHCGPACKAAARAQRLATAASTFALCSVDGCEKRVRSRNATLCGTHYHRIYRNGTLELTSPQRSARGICVIDGCGKTDCGLHGLCQKHLARQRRNGDPHTLRGHQPKIGPENPAWIGNLAGYTAVHDRIRFRNGSATTQTCVGCGCQAAHWSYNHSDPDEVYENDMAYSYDIEHYSPRCIPCHKLFDLALIERV